MPRINLRQMLISLPLALLTTIAMLTISEIGYLKASEEVIELEHTQTTRTTLYRVLQSMLDAETGQRGYLLTGEERYKEPYQKGISTIYKDLDSLRTIFVGSAEDLDDLAKLSRSISQKIAEMELSVRLRQQGNEEAWRFIVYTDVGKENMDSIRLHSRSLIDRSLETTMQSQQDIRNAAALARWGIITLSLAALIAFYFYLRQTRNLQTASARQQLALESERDRLEALVRERTSSLTELANHLQQVREDERAHLARELHDELGALLTAAKLDVARLKSRIDTTAPETAERIKHLIETLNSGIALKRRIIEDLRPSSLSNLGLTASLEILAREFSDRSGVNAELDLEELTLPEATQLTVYRLVQESLTNIGKYAEAQNVMVSAAQYPTHVEVKIQDDGKGFATEDMRPNSHGLTGMHYRVEAAGGKLTVSSQPGQGTTVFAVLPSTPQALQPVAVAPRTV